jgi:hypothetical protein
MAYKEEEATCDSLSKQYERNKVQLVQYPARLIKKCLLFSVSLPA